MIFARHTSAIPPAARRDPISYLLNAVPGCQGDGSATAAGADSRRVADGADALSGACQGAASEDAPLFAIERATAGMGDQRRKGAKLNCPAQK